MRLSKPNAWRSVKICFNHCMQVKTISETGLFKSLFYVLQTLGVDHYLIGITCVHVFKAPEDTGFFAHSLASLWPAPANFYPISTCFAKLH